MIDGDLWAYLYWVEKAKDARKRGDSEQEKIYRQKAEEYR